MKNQGIDQRPHLAAKHGLIDLRIEELGDVHLFAADHERRWREEDAAEVAEDIHEQRVDTERLEETAPRPVTFHIDDIYRQGEQARGHAVVMRTNVGDHIFFAHRAAIAEQPSRKDERRADETVG